MRQFFPVEELARDERFSTITMRERMADPRAARPAEAPSGKPITNRLTPERPDASDAARALMHGIFVGEIQALEGAGRTCWDFTTGDGADEAPFALKLDMARQCWDEARHVEISVQARRLDGHRDRRVRREHRAVRGGLQPRPGAAPGRREPGARRPRHRRLHHDEGVRRPRRRPVPRVLRGLDAGRRGHPREDGLGLAAPAHRRRTRSGEGRRSSSRRSSTSCSRYRRLPLATRRSRPIGLARRFRELAGFTNDEIDEIARLSAAALHEARCEAARGPTSAARRPSPRHDRHRHPRAVHDGQLRGAEIERPSCRAARPARAGRPRCPGRGRRDDARSAASQVESTATRSSSRPRAGRSRTRSAPRQLSASRHRHRRPAERSCGSAIARRLRFADAPGRRPTSRSPSASSWDAYSIGRLERLGYPSQRQRWLYNFRNRHGFTDVADAAFDRLWTAPSLTWDEIVALSDERDRPRDRRLTPAG